jgi:hypothetical protein
MMRSKSALLGLVSLLSTPASLAATMAQAAPIDKTLARQYFEEAREVSERDNGRLWGVPLYGPMMFVDRQTRFVVANQPDREGKLAKSGEVFVGTLPETVLVANTATDWAGVHWTMVVWPLPQNKLRRAGLMMHESFHRIQDKIGLRGGNPSNSHLDSLDGRLWLRLEMRALRAALIASGELRLKAIQDAICFRACRRALFPQAREQERALEMNEGLAEYSGVAASRSAGDAGCYTAGVLESYDDQQSFVRSFAYATGPAYGLLLDSFDLTWRKTVKDSDDLALVLQTVSRAKPPESTKQEAESRSLNYDSAYIRAQEAERDSKRKQRIAEYRARFIDGPRLVLPLTGQVNYSFDPLNLEALDDASTVYPTLRVTDEWGILTVSNGALMRRENGRVISVTVSAPSDPKARPLRGDGWSLELQPGWKVREGSKGELYLEKDK